MIEIYPSKLDGAPLETHATHERMTLEQWLIANVPSYAPRAVAPISIHLNGELVGPQLWVVTDFGPSDSVRICPEPKGEAVVAGLITAAISLAVSLTLTFLLQPKKPKANQGPGQGNALEESAAKGNKVKLNTPIREIAGRRKVYPDYLLPLRRYFGSPREQWAEMFLCIGKGEYQIDTAELLIGDTPMDALGDDVEYAIYEPGADLSAEVSAQWWHSAPEVGATSTGTSGLDLRAANPVEPIPAIQQYLFSGFTVDASSGADEYPAGWAAGMLVRIESPRNWTVIDGGAGADIIEGNFAELAPFVGMQLEIIGDNAGLYEVASYTPPVLPSTIGQITLSFVGGGAVTALKIGTVSMGLGYAGLRYRITAATATQITVERLTDTGATDSGWTGFATLSSQDAILTLDSTSVEGSFAGPFAACPQNEVSSTVEFDIMFPGGLTGVDKKGRKYYYSVTVETQWRDMATAGAWTSVIKTYTQATLDQIGFTERIDLPYAMRPEVRMRRIGADSDATTIQDSVQWYGLRSRLSAPTSYAGVTTMAVRVRGGSRIAAQSEQLVAVTATRKLPIHSGSGWSEPTPTRDIAPWVAYVAKSIGYTDDDLDLAEFDRLHAIWSARGDTYDNAVERASTVKQSFTDALLPGYADITLDRGLIRPVRDEPRSTFEHMYTPQNMTDPLSRKFSSPQPDDFDGVDVEYVDGLTWQVETVKCRLPGDAGSRVEKIQADGVTDRTRAWRIGMRQRRAQKYRRWQHSWATELDALNSRYLSFCAVADDVPGYGQSALLMAIEAQDGGHLLESSEPLTWSDGEHVVAIRRPDGTLSGPYAATRVGDFHMLVGEIDFAPDTSWDIEPPHLLFGTSTRWSFPVLVTSISPSGDGASVEAMNYDERVYADDDNVPA